MAANKKTKKKYVPKPTYHHNLINQINSFKPFEDALEKFLEKGEVEVDDGGMFIFRDGLGNPHSFTVNLKMYVNIIDIYGVRKKRAFNTRAITILQNRMFERRGFVDTEIEEAKQQLQLCKRIVCSITPIELKQILSTIRVSLALDASIDPKLSEPELMLSKIKGKIGDLTFEDIVAKDEEYQELSKAYPKDEHIQNLRDIYSGALSAYRFVRMKEIQNKASTV